MEHDIALAQSQDEFWALTCDYKYKCNTVMFVHVSHVQHYMHVMLQIKSISVPVSVSVFLPLSLSMCVFHSAILHTMSNECAMQKEINAII